MNIIKINSKYGNVSIKEGNSFEVKSFKCKTRMLNNELNIQGYDYPLEIVLRAGNYGSLFIRTSGGSIDVNLPNCAFDAVDTESNSGKSNIVLNYNGVGSVSSPVSSLFSVNSSSDTSVPEELMPRMKVNPDLCMNSESLWSDV